MFVLESLEIYMSERLWFLGNSNFPEQVGRVNYTSELAVTVTCMQVIHTSVSTVHGVLLLMTASERTNIL